MAGMSDLSYQKVVAELKASRAHIARPGNRSEAESLLIVAWLMITSLPLRTGPRGAEYQAAGARAERLREQIKALPVVTDALLDELLEIRGALPQPPLRLDPTIHTPPYLERIVGRMEAAVERAAR